MKRRIIHIVLALALVGSLGVLLAAQKADAYQASWLDQVTEYVLMEKAITTEGTFAPYLDQLKHMRTPVEKGDWVGTFQGMTHFMDLLEHRAGGIPEKTAQAIWDYCYKVTPTGLHTEHEQIKAMGLEAYQQWKDRQEYADWHARNSF